MPLEAARGSPPSIFINDSFDRPKDNIELLLLGDCLQRSLDTAAQIVCTPLVIAHRG